MSHREGKGPLCKESCLPHQRVREQRRPSLRGGKVHRHTPGDAHEPGRALPPAPSRCAGEGLFVRILLCLPVLSPRPP